MICPECGTAVHETKLIEATRGATSWILPRIPFMGWYEIKSGPHVQYKTKYTTVTAVDTEMIQSDTMQPRKSHCRWADDVHEHFHFSIKNQYGQTVHRIARWRITR